jgi:hypothetical protein
MIICAAGHDLCGEGIALCGEARRSTTNIRHYSAHVRGACDGVAVSAYARFVSGTIFRLVGLVQEWKTLPIFQQAPWTSL